MNDVLYTIERVGTKKKDNHVKVDVNFYTETENLNGDERSDTNKSIRRYLGTYNDFIFSSLKTDRKESLTVHLFKPLDLQNNAPINKPRNNPTSLTQTAN